MDNMMDNISEIIGGMSKEDMDSLREAAQSMFGSSVGTDKTTENNDADNSSPFSGIDPAMFAKLSSIMASMNKKDDRSDLIAALKPHLSESRRKKADEAIQILKLLDILPMIQSSMGFENSNTE